MITDLHSRLIELLNRRQKASDEWWRGRKTNPLSGKPLKKGDRPDVFPTGATDRQLDKFSARTGVTLPSGLREWLKITNGAAGFFGVPPVQRGCSIEELWGFRPDWKDRAWIPIGRDDFGNYYVQLAPMASNAAIQPVVFVEAIGDSVYVVASDALHFALFRLEEGFGIHEELAKSKGLEAFFPRAKLRRDAPKLAMHPWPFSKKYMLFRDPRLAYVEGLRLPWKR